ncbi:MAG TPA: tetratricopeptide repeat protein, partial [Jatrophihabitans sp.]|nr:tetratricopeptide repeat protein [Jatrophihabitans sp.]
MRVLPPEARALLGRADELAAVRAALGEPGGRLVTITGPPGVGKTRLALAVAHSLAAAFADGVVWVDLAPLRDPDGVLAEIARGLDVRVGARPAARTIGSALAERELLVVLDNVEHLLAAAPQVGELLADVPGLRVLATSRERLRLAAEREFPLPPLPMPAPDDLGDLVRLRANPALALLVERAPGAVTLTVRSAPALTDICLRLDGLPLALELAAARLRVFTPAELAFRLERRTAALAAAARDAPDRHRDLRTAIAWSHDLLPERERAAFRRLSVFAGEWTLDAAAAVCDTGEAVDVVASLLDKNLVRRVDAAAGAAQARFAMLMSLREFAAEQLDAAGEVGPTRDRHAAYFAGLAAGWERAIGGGGETEAWLAVAEARADLLVALEHARARGTARPAMRLLAALAWYWYTHGYLAEAAPLRDLLATVPDGPDGPAADADDADEADARDALRLGAGIVTFGLGEHAAARQHLTAVLAAGDPRRTAIARAFVGHLAREQGDYDAAANCYAAAAAASARIGNRRGVAWAEHDLGLLALDRGDGAAAERHLREGLRLFRDLDYDWAVAVCAWGLGTARLRAGDRDEAAALLAEALARHRALGDGRGVAQCLESIAELALAQGAAATTARLLGAAAAQRQATGAPPSAAEE